MNKQLLKWKDEYNIGQPSIDEAHKKLIAVLRHILDEDAIDTDANIQFKVKELIKYLKHYTLTHFPEEEKYMESIGYAGFYTHKFMHANFRDLLLPTMEQELETNFYSRDSIYQFAIRLSDWLEAHILTEDRAIAGKAISRYTSVAAVQKRLYLDREFRRFLHSFLFKPTLMKNWFYDGEILKETLAHEFVFKDGMGNEYNIICLISKQLILSILSSMLGENIYRVDKISVKVYYNLMGQLGQAIYSSLYPEYNFAYDRVSMFFMSDYRERYAKKAPKYSMIWETELGIWGLIMD